jgi:hypothetical protein
VLRKECELDGTHMSPYCIIWSFLKKVWEI